MSIKDKIFLITGGARGLGKGFATILASEGAKVIIIDLLEDVGVSTTNEINSTYPGQALFYEGDVTDVEAIKKIWEDGERKFNGKIEVLVNNAGVGVVHWKKVLNINLMSLMELSYFAIDRMSIKNGGKGGTILNVASIAGLWSICPRGMVPYTVSKAAVVSFTKSLASSDILSTDGIHVGAICPYFADTDMIANGRENVDRIVSSHGKEVISVDRVAKHFLKLVQDTTNGLIPNGSFIAVMPEETTYNIVPKI